MSNNIKCLFKLNYKELKKLAEDTLDIEGWYIREEDIKKRTELIRCTERYKYLEKKANKEKILFNDNEIVTWLDSLTTLYYTFEEIKDKHLKENVTILQEYCIPYQNKRADYLLIYDNKILIIEFSFKKLGYELQYETKLQQSIGYKELLSNVLPKEIDIGTYTFLIEAEEDKNRNTITLKNSKFLPNHYKIENLARFIEKFFNKNINLAISALNQL